jgi:hypothetical protein
MKILALAVAVVLGILPDIAGARVRGVPPMVELDGCVKPTDGCAAVRDVVKINVGDRKLDFAVEQLRLLTSTASPGKVLTELKVRPLIVQGPKELTAKLTAGAHVRVRGTLRLASQMLLLQSVEPSTSP